MLFTPSSVNYQLYFYIFLFKDYYINVKYDRLIFVEIDPYIKADLRYTY